MIRARKLRRLIRSRIQGIQEFQDLFSLLRTLMHAIKRFSSIAAAYTCVIP